MSSGASMGTRRTEYFPVSSSAKSTSIWPCVRGGRVGDEGRERVLGEAGDAGARRDRRSEGRARDPGRRGRGRGRACVPELAPVLLGDLGLDVGEGEARDRLQGLEDPEAVDGRRLEVGSALAGSGPLESLDGDGCCGCRACCTGRHGHRARREPELGQVRLEVDERLAVRLPGRDLAVRDEDDPVDALQDELASWRCRRPGPGTV